MPPCVPLALLPAFCLLPFIPYTAEEDLLEYAINFQSTIPSHGDANFLIAHLQDQDLTSRPRNGRNLSRSLQQPPAPPHVEPIASIPSIFVRCRHTEDSEPAALLWAARHPFPCQVLHLFDKFSCRDPCTSSIPAVVRTPRTTTEVRYDTVCAVPHVQSLPVEWAPRE